MNNLDHYIDYLLELVLSEIEPITKNIDKVMFLKMINILLNNIT